MNKKLLSYLLTFVLLLLPVSVTVASAAPASYAPEYTFFVGETELGYGNIADGKELFNGEAGFESGLFPLMVQVTNAKAALVGTFVIKYDAAKVKPMYYKTGKGGGWLEATSANKVWYSSEFSSATSASSNVSGVYADETGSYVWSNWYAGSGSFDAEAVLAEGSNPEVGAIVFSTQDGVTTADFDSETFTIVTDLLPEGNAIRTGLASNGSPLTCNVKIDGVEKQFGISDTAPRQEMTVNFIYPNSDKEPGVPGPVEPDVPVVPEEPDEEITDVAEYAPQYTFFIGETELGYGNIADGKELFNGEAGFESGLFPLMVQVTNAKAALVGTFVIKYDATKVKPMYYKTGKSGGWLEATSANKVWYSSEFSSATSASSNVSGVYADETGSYVWSNWYAGSGSFDAEAVLAGGSNPEVGAIVFSTQDGVTVDDFDANTFTIVTDLLPEGNAIRTGLASNGSPLTCNAKINGVEKQFGISDSAPREAMTVRRIYGKVDKIQRVPANTPAPVETFDVVFMANDAVIATITKNVGETVTVAEFPTNVVAPEGYKFIGWDVTADITAAATVNAVFEKIDTTPRTVSAVTKAGKTCTVTTDLLYIPEGAVILVAGYNGKEMVAFEKVNYTKAQEIFNLAAEVDIEKVKVMVWANTSATAAPITIAEVK